MGQANPGRREREWGVTVLFLEVILELGGALTLGG
jgi:hypothetical protein